MIDDAYWGGKKGDGKRDRGVTGKMPFVAALSLSKKGHPLLGASDSYGIAPQTAIGSFV